MRGSSVTVQRSQVIDGPPDLVWPLLSGPEAWLLRPDRFAFDVDIPPHTRLRVVLGVTSQRLHLLAYVIRDELPGQAISLHAARPVIGSQHVLRLSAVPEGLGTAATIAASFPTPGDSGAIRYRWERLLMNWLGRMRDVAEGRAARPGPGVPEALRVACMPITRLARPMSASASAVIDAQADAVWEAVWSPTSVVEFNPQVVCAGTVPGTPTQQTGEMQYFFERLEDGSLRPELLVVTELAAGRSARTTSPLTRPRLEMLHTVTPRGSATLFELTCLWPAAVGRVRSKAIARP